MWYDKLDYRNKINIDKWITFGVEIEFAEARRKLIRTLMTRMYNDDIIDELWNIENDETIYEAFFSTKGGEAISPILRDNEASWHDLKAVCKISLSFSISNCSLLFCKISILDIIIFTNCLQCSAIIQRLLTISGKRLF